MSVLEGRCARHRRDYRIAPVAIAVGKQDRHHISDPKAVRVGRRYRRDLRSPLRLSDRHSSKCRVARKIRRRAKAQSGDSVIREVVGIRQIADL